MEQVSALSATPLPDQDTCTSPRTSSPDPLTALEFDNVVGYKLSDAIRDGAKGLKQEYGWGDGVETGCALTAARVAVESRGYGVDK